jgi:rubredoxin-NAD+ reductase
MKPIVIVGSGLAGYSVAKELRKLDTAVAITLVSADGCDFYSKPTLSNAFALKRAPATLTTSAARQMSADFRLDIVPHCLVTALNPAAGSLRAGARDIEYSRLVLATGGHPVRPTLPGSGGDRIRSVNHLDDYRTFRAALDSCRRVAVLGAGLVGCEFANDLVTAGFHVDVIDVTPWPLARFWPQPMADVFRERLAAAGVRWHLGRSVERVDASGEGVSILLGDGESISADILLSAVGLSPNVALAEAAGLEVARGIVVDRFLRSSDERIFALGDCAEVEGRLLPFILPIMHGARALAKTLAGAPCPVIYPPMPVVLKTPACPTVFFPAAEWGGGKWHIEREADGMRGHYRTAEGKLLGAALSGSCTRERDAVQKQLQTISQES